MVVCSLCCGYSTVVSWYVLGRSFVVCVLSRFVSLWSLEGLLVVFVVFACFEVVWSKVVWCVSLVCCDLGVDCLLMVVKDLELAPFVCLWSIVCLSVCVVIVVCVFVLCSVVFVWSSQRGLGLVFVHSPGRCICWLWRMLFVWC